MTKRENSGFAAWWKRHKAWVSGLSKGQRIAYRVGCVAAWLLAIVLALRLALSLVATKPVIPGGLSGPDVSGWEQEDSLAQSGRRADVFTFLLVGRDTAGGGNTDTMILATFDARAQTLRAMSLPRDTMVNVSWRTKKLNTVYNYHKGKDKATQVQQGMTALKEHVGKLTGIVPDYYVVVEWDAVGEIVDAIGGVTFDVPYDMHYDDDTPGQDLHIHQNKGKRRLSGDDAMQVIRWRKNNGQYGNFQIGDAGRMKVQQDFLKAVVSQCLQTKNIVNIPALADIVLDNVTTDLTVGNLVWLAQQAIGMDVGEDISFYTMPYTNYARGTAYVLPAVDELLTVLNDSGLNPYKRAVVAEDLEVLVLKSNGAMTLTSGKLADTSLTKATGKTPTDQTPSSAQPVPPVQPETPVVEPEKPVEPEIPVEPEVPVDPEMPTEPDSPAEPDTPAEPETPAEPVDPEETESPAESELQDIVTEVVQQPTPELPATPTPVE